MWADLIAPPLGMLGAATVYLRLRRRREVDCAKLVHDRESRCIFTHCCYENPHPIADEE